MKKIINTIKIFRLITKYPKIMGVVSEIFNTLNKVSEEKKPRTQNIIIDFNNGELIETINLWIAIGKEANPIIRIQEMRKEIDELKNELNTLN